MTAFRVAWARAPRKRGDLPLRQDLRAPTPWASWRVMSDRPSPRELSSVPEAPIGSVEGGPLAPFAGARPPAPAWFEAAMAHPVDAGATMVAGARLETLSWGRPGDPLVMLMHGNGAHAGWWRALAPLLVRPGRRLVAFSFSGMGGSDWREAYAMATFSEEVLAVADAHRAGSTTAPVLIGHSFGGFPALHAAVHAPGAIAGLMMLDSSIEPPGEEWEGPPRRGAPNRVYPTLEEALARFRLAPPQPCDNAWILDAIARESLKPVDGGWTWKFDPFLWNSFAFGSAQDLPRRLRAPVAVLRGAQSFLMEDRVWNHMRGLFPATAAFVTVPEARHHLMLDQPLATVAALDAILATWGR
jgi:pimeloyl-ACP methyl ester carboxylesterase